MLAVVWVHPHGSVASRTLWNVVQELELLEKRGQSMKTKAETQAKYGW